MKLRASAFLTLLVAALVLALGVSCALAPVPIDNVSLSAGAGKTTTRDYDLGAAVATTQYTYTVTGLQSGKSAYTRIQLRNYSVVVKVTSGAADYMQLERVVNGATTILAGIDLTNVPITTARNLYLSVSQTATGPKIQSVAWTSGTMAQGLKLEFTDATASNIASGNGLGISVYLQGSATQPVTIAYKSIIAQADKPGINWGNPVFEENFDGTALSPTKWNIRDNTYVGYDWAEIRASNVAVNGGNLILSTNKLAAPVVRASDGKQRWHTSAYIDTIGKFSQPNGKYEIRAKLPTVKGNSRGIWPAFWLRPDSGGDGEVDIFEAYGTPSAQSWDTSWRTEATVHYWAPDRNGVSKKVSAWTPSGIDVNDGQFHTWTAEFTPTQLDFLVDGTKYYTVKASDDARWGRAFGSNRNYHIRVNVQVGSEYWGVPEAGKTADHTEYVIDYVRAWKYTA